MKPANDSDPTLESEGQGVDCDETYVGGQPRRKDFYAKPPRDGRLKEFDKRNAAVVGGVERDGHVQARVVNGFGDTADGETITSNRIEWFRASLKGRVGGTHHGDSLT